MTIGLLELVLTLSMCLFYFSHNTNIYSLFLINSFEVCLQLKR